MPHVPPLKDEMDTSCFDDFPEEDNSSWVFLGFELPAVCCVGLQPPAFLRLLCPHGGCNQRAGSPCVASKRLMVRTPHCSSSPTFLIWQDKYNDQNFAELWKNEFT